MDLSNYDRKKLQNLLVAVSSSIFVFVDSDDEHNTMCEDLQWWKDEIETAIKDNEFEQNTLPYGISRLHN